MNGYIDLYFTTISILCLGLEEDLLLRLCYSFEKIQLQIQIHFTLLYKYTNEGHILRFIGVLKSPTNKDIPPILTLASELEKQPKKRATVQIFMVLA